MLHNEARKLLVEGYEATHNAETIAKIFHVNKYTVYHLEERKRKTGSVDLQTWRRGRKALLSSTDKARIAECITKNPTINLEELRTQLGLKVSISTMSRVVRALGFRVKKVGLSATERERPRCAGKTYQVERLKAPPHNHSSPSGQTNSSSQIVCSTICSCVPEMVLQPQSTQVYIVVYKDVLFVHL